MVDTVSYRAVRGGKFEYTFEHPIVNPLTYQRVGMQTILTSTQSDNIVLTETVTKSSSRTPNWRNVIRTGIGLTACNYRYSKVTMMKPYRDTYTREIAAARTYHMVGYWDGDGESTFPLQLALAAPSARDIEGCVIRATQKCLEQMKDQKVNLAQAFAERQQTANLIGNILGDVAKLIRSIRKGDVDGAVIAIKKYVSRRGAKRFRKDLDLVADEASRRWLQFQYGLRPLVAEINGAVEALSKSEKPQRMKATGFASTGTNFTKNPDMYTVQSFRNEHTVKIVVHYEVPGVVLPTLSSLGLTNPALLAWELLPWSFVADWALPIGDWLSTFDAASGLVFTYGSETSYTKLDAQRVINYDVKDGDGHYFGSVKSSGSSVEIVRRKLDGFPLPRFPQFKNPFSLEHFANAAALVRQVSR